MLQQKTLGALVVGLSAVCASLQVSASTVVVDDANFGAATVLRDTSTYLEYLRLDLSSGYGYNGVLAQSGVGGVFESWTVASTADMQSLGSSLGIIHGSSDSAQVSLVENLRDWFCPAGSCVNLSSTHEVARGLVSDAGPDYASGAPSLLAFSMGRQFNVNPEAVDFRISGYGGYNHSGEEIWLVRTSEVPVPAAAWLFGSSLLGFGAAVRRKKA